MAADLFRLVWTPPTGGQPVASEPLAREKALRSFNACLNLRRAIGVAPLTRLRVMSDAEYQRLHGGQ